MIKQYLHIVIALVGVASLGMTAKGEVIDQIVAKIPYEFVAAGKTLPAGTYRVNRVNDTNQGALVLSSFENRMGAIVLSAEVESSSGNNVHVSFEQVGGQHFLSKIETADHVFTIPVSRSEILEAAARSHGGASGSGTASGSN